MVILIYFSISFYIREEKSFFDLAKKMLSERINKHEFESNGIKIKFKKVKNISGDVIIPPHYLTKN